MVAGFRPRPVRRSRASPTGRASPARDHAVPDCSTVLDAEPSPAAGTPARAGDPADATPAGRAGHVDAPTHDAAPARGAPPGSRAEAAQQVVTGPGAPSGPRWLWGLRGLVAVALPTAVAAAHASLYGRWEVDDAGITFA